MAMNQTAALKVGLCLLGFCYSATRSSPSTTKLNKIDISEYSAFDPFKEKNGVSLKALIFCNKFTTVFSNSSSMDSFPRSLNPNKHLREQFVSNLLGSSMLEVSALLNNVALLMLLRHTFCSQIVNDTCRSLKSYLTSVALDYVFIVLPTLLIFTVLAEWVYICIIGLLFLLIFFTAVKRTYSLPYMEGPNASRASISSYKMFITCLCILAVDFRIYPREYAKTETYMTSLNTFIQDRKEMASVLYTYPSCVKALPQGVCWNSQFGIQKLAAETGAASIYCGFWF
ncbi:uncharacterized protein LOC108449941 isoform X2 [Gossypium arboreum]|uniref:uncharacterized protein LOC108449941 isoform X2 n=1 Tax=Gossypium arboreum TaxID=29729 RepID=UPI0008193580|nr:uncharacterized protein LOC108449941 isoform X2 [Gossypium arboreum]